MEGYDPNYFGEHYLSRWALQNVWSPPRQLLWWVVQYSLEQLTWDEVLFHHLQHPTLSLLSTQLDNRKNIQEFLFIFTFSFETSFKTYYLYMFLFCSAILFTYNKYNLFIINFKCMYSSISFKKYMSHCYNQDTEYFNHSNNYPCALSQSIHTRPSSS